MKRIKSKVWLVMFVVCFCLALTACGNSAQGEQVEKEISWKDLSVETGMIQMSGSIDDWEYKNQYIIQSQNELNLFLSYMGKEVLNKYEAFSEIDFSQNTLLITICERDWYRDYGCLGARLKGNELELNYYVDESEGGACVLTLYFPYAIVSNSELTANSYEGWVTPSEVFGE